MLRKESVNQAMRNAILGVMIEVWTDFLGGLAVYTGAQANAAQARCHCQSGRLPGALGAPGRSFYGAEAVRFLGRPSLCCLIFRHLWQERSQHRFAALGLSLDVVLAGHLLV